MYDLPEDIVARTGSIVNKIVEVLTTYAKNKCSKYIRLNIRKELYRI